MPRVAIRLSAASGVVFTTWTSAPTTPGAPRSASGRTSSMRITPWNNADTTSSVARGSRHRARASIARSRVWTWPRASRSSATAGSGPSWISTLINDCRVDQYLGSIRRRSRAMSGAASVAPSEANDVAAATAAGRPTRTMVIRSGTASVRRSRPAR